MGTEEYDAGKPGLDDREISHIKLVLQALYAIYSSPDGYGLVRKSIDITVTEFLSSPFLRPNSEATQISF